MGRAPVEVGDVFAFHVGNVWVPCQILRPGSMGRWEIVVFDVTSAELPDPASIAGAQLYVIRRGKPRNQPLYLVCSNEPPEAFELLGNRPVALAFPLPTSFKTSVKNQWEDSCPSAATWGYAVDRVKLDRAAAAPPYRSKLFPGWTSVDPRALRAIDAAVTRFDAVKPATEAALRRCVVATNKQVDEIQTIRPSPRTKRRSCGRRPSACDAGLV